MPTSGAERVPAGSSAFWRLIACTVALCLVRFGPALGAAPEGGSGFSDLAAITPVNVARLSRVLTFRMPEQGGYGGTVRAGGGLVFVQTPFPHTVYAIDPARSNSPVRWRVAPEPDRMAAGQDCCGTNDGGPVLDGGRLYLNTFDGHTMALDAGSGRVIWDVRTAEPGKGETLPGAPLVAGGQVFVGNGGDDFGARGWVEALDPGSGRVRWRQYSTGPDREVGIGPDFERRAERGRNLGTATWPPDAWQQGGGSGGGLVYDAALYLLLHSTGHPAPWNPDQRTGENRWTSGLFARNPATGAASWFTPVNPHDLYALGAGPSNLLVDGTWRGTARRLLVHPDANGRVYVVDRTSGELLSAEAFVPTNATKGVDLPTGTLVRDDARAVSPNSTTRDICPGWPGATGPGAAAYNPGTKLLYIPANLLCMDMEARNTSFIAGTPYTGANLRIKAEPGRKRGGLIAWDVEAAKPAWAAPEGFPIAGGVLATAGGLVFYGTLDGWLKALDARTGAPVWQYRLESGVIGTPSTFPGPDGRQFVAVLAGVGGIGRVASRSIDVRDATAANGYANALRDLPPRGPPGGMLYLFALPQ